MLKNRYYKETLCAPVSGTVRRRGVCEYIIECADEENGDIVSPMEGTVMRICGGNRVSICSAEGTTVSVGVGMLSPGRTNTADGCHFYVREGETVNRGQRLMHAQLSRIRRMGGGAECVMTVDGAAGIGQPAETAETVRAGVTPIVYVQ